MVSKTDSGNHQNFYDLEDLQLNIDPNTQQRSSSWGNLGYWQLDELEASTQLSYPQACEQLALQLAKCANLDQLPDSHVVLDTGFGCGDQLVVWQKQCSVNSLYGINYSQAQTEFAQQVINGAGLTGFTLIQADCCDPKAWQTIPKPIDRILALDCVYHFHDKAQYLDLCAKHLVPNGILAISDLLLTKPISNPLHKLMLKLICKLSHIPFSNLKTEQDMAADLSRRGLKLVHSNDISAAVFLPFGDWLNGHIKQIKNAQVADQKTSWIKYKGTAQFLRWAYNHRILSYRLLQIKKAH